jgi:hypothetical protein
VGAVARLEAPDCTHGAGPLLLWVTAIGEVRRESDGARHNYAATSFPG